MEQSHIVTTEETTGYDALILFVSVQEEPEELYESIHPSIMPLKEAAQTTEEPGKINYITVHYSRMPRLNTVTRFIHDGFISPVVLSIALLCFCLFTVWTRSRSQTYRQMVRRNSKMTPALFILFSPSTKNMGENNLEFETF